MGRKSESAKWGAGITRPKQTKDGVQHRIGGRIMHGESGMVGTRKLSDKNTARQTFTIGTPIRESNYDHTKKGTTTRSPSIIHESEQRTRSDGQK